jgi:hypothetical protein
MHADAPKVDISPTVERAAVRLDTIDGEVTEGRETERKTLLEEFISAFAADNLLSHVQSKF